MAFSHKHSPHVKRPAHKKSTCRRTHTPRLHVQPLLPAEERRSRMAAAMVHVINASGGDYWTVALLDPADWRAAIAIKVGESVQRHGSLIFWCHPASEGGGRIRFASDDDARLALRRNWPELALPVLPRIVVDERAGVAAPPSLPLPGSPRWLAELAGVNPMQAALVATLFEHAGTTRCCCVCGDTEQVADYLVLTPGASRSLARLCADCREIQQRMGSVFGPARPLAPEGPGGMRKGA